MQRLAQLKWQGRALVTGLQHGNGLEAYTLTPGLIPVHEEQTPPAPAPSGPAYTAAPREAVIAFSREHYARPRVEVERQIAELNGWELPEETMLPEVSQPPQQSEPPADETAQQSQAHPSHQDAPNGSDASADSSPRQRPAPSLRRRLRTAVSPACRRKSLLITYSRERIERQLEWLPYRDAKNPAGYLLSAIERDYAEPLALRQERATQAVAAENPATEQSVAEQTIPNETVNNDIINSSYDPVANSSLPYG